MIPHFKNIDAGYNYHLKHHPAMSFHLPKLLELADQCESILEFGVHHVGSTWAFLKSAKNRGHPAAPIRITSVDITKTKEVDDAALAALADKVIWEFVRSNTLTYKPTQNYDMLFIDDLHDRIHVKRELDIHGDRINKFIVFHDTTQHADLKDAINDYVNEHPHWKVVYVTEEMCGLTVIQREN